MPLCDKLRGYEEVDGLLLHRNRIGRHRLVDESSVDAHGYVDGLLHTHLGGAAQVHHIGHIAKIDAIDKIPAASLSMLVFL